MKDWREELQRAEKPAAAKSKDPALCNCKALMKRKWVNCVYMCQQCNKPVYG